jgi:hypothetical protein
MKTEFKQLSCAFEEMKVSKKIKKKVNFFNSFHKKPFPISLFFTKTKYLTIEYNLKPKMSLEQAKPKKKTFLADLFGEMPSLDDLERTSTETKQDHQSCSIETAKKTPTSSPPLAIKSEGGSALNSDIDHNSLQNSQPSVSIDDLLNYINVSNEERRDASHVTPPYSPPSHDLGDFEKRKIKEKKTKKNRRKRMAKQATIKHNDRPLASVDDMEFDSLLDSYTQVQQKVRVNCCFMLGLGLMWYAFRARGSIMKMNTRTLKILWMLLQRVSRVVMGSFLALHLWQ